MTVQRQRLQQFLKEVSDFSVAETKPRRRQLSSMASVSALPVTAADNAVTAPGAAPPRAPGAPLAEDMPLDAFGGWGNRGIDPNWRPK